MKNMDDTKPKKLSTKEQDEQTVFALAALCMDIHAGTLVRNTKLLSLAFMKVNTILAKDPGFVERFNKARAAIQQLIKLEMSQISVPDETKIEGAHNARLHLINPLSNGEGEEHA